jgi:1,4-dihydroxy-2-naphthoyl-CoA hydrolase
MNPIPYTIRLADTDAAGRLYFAAAGRIAHAAFEEWIAALGYPLGPMIATGPVLLPIVHAETTFTRPLALGDQLTITTTVARLGQKSVTFDHQLRDTTNRLCATVRLTHAAVSRKTGRAIALPAPLRKALTSPASA